MKVDNEIYHKKRRRMKMRRKVSKMKSNLKSKIIILITIGIFLGLLPIYTNNISDDIAIDKDILKTSEVSGKISINGNSGWLAFKSDGNCTGEGIFSNPYVIEDLIINASGSGSCILIQNSDVYFIIKNCTVYNSGPSWGTAGIRLSYVENGNLIDNNCTSSFVGIDLEDSSNNSASGNDANNNTNSGIRVKNSSNTTLSDNTADNNDEIGIYVEICRDINITDNDVNENGWTGIYLGDSNGSTISKNTVNYNTEFGFYLASSDRNVVTGNTANNNTNDGINLWYSDNNNLSGNTAYNNTHGIYLVECNNNTLSENSASNNYFNGIILSSGNNNTLSGNNASNNNLYGIILSSGNSNTLSGNTAYNNTYGIYLSGNDNTLSGNTISNNSYGIWLDSNSNNNTLSGNTANNSDYGISIYYSDNNTLSGNTANNNTYGIGLSGNNNTLSGNTAYNNSYGIYLSGNNNTLSGNTAYNNHIGIYISGSYNNTLSGNTANNNFFGIAIFVSNNNTLSGNNASNNNYGISISDSSNNTKIFLNHFINNEINAVDNGINNTWDDGFIGNYWDDYAGVDANDNGIGDTPYTIPGAAGSQDNYPIFWDPPVFSVNSPSQNDNFSINSPNFDISIEEGVVNLLWYTLDGGTTNFTFTGLTGTIDQTIWDSVSEGDVTIRFYVNDSAGNIAFEEVTINKDITAPIITINSPSTDEFFGNSAPGYNLTIIESNIHTMWYTLDGGITNKTFTGLTGTIDQALWNSISEGDVTIRFYANDTMNKIAFEEITINKDTTAPIITINSPSTSEIFGINAPGYNLTIIESNIHTRWYTLDSGTTNFTFTGLTGTIDQTIWDSISEGDITIRFYVNDSAGNINFEEIEVIKRIPEEIGIPGYNLFFLLGILSVVAIVISTKLKKFNK